MGDTLKGDYKPQSTSRQLKSLSLGLQRYLPSITKSIGESTAPAARYNLATEQEIAPQEQQLNADLFSRFAPQYAEAGGAADLAAIKGSGGEAARASDILERAINPEYFATRASSADKLQQLLAGMDPNKLTGSERDEVARGLARSNYGTGELAVPTGGGAIKAALTYGDALRNKRASVAAAINTATQALPQFRGTNDVFQQATGRSGTATFSQGGGQNFLGSSPTQGAAQGSNLLNLSGDIEKMRQQLLSQRRTVYDAVNQSYSAAGSGTSGFAAAGACYIMREAMDYNIPDWFSKLLPYIFTPSLTKQYLKLAERVVPIMRTNKSFKEWVKNNFALPILRHYAQ